MFNYSLTKIKSIIIESNKDILCSAGIVAMNAVIYSRVSQGTYMDNISSGSFSNMFTEEVSRYDAGLVHELETLGSVVHTLLPGKKDIYNRICALFYEMAVIINGDSSDVWQCSVGFACYLIFEDLESLLIEISGYLPISDSRRGNLGTRTLEMLSSYTVMMHDEVRGRCLFLRGG
jgi:hypothetical protein